MKIRILFLLFLALLISCEVSDKNIVDTEGDPIDSLNTSDTSQADTTDTIIDTIIDTLSDTTHDSTIIDTITDSIIDSCISSSTPIFTHSFTDFSMITGIVPPGSVSGDEIKPHTYITNAIGANVPIIAPTDCKLYNGAYYQEGGINQYALYFEVSCEVTFMFDHIITVTDTIASYFPVTPQNDTRTGADFGNPFILQAGDTIGFTTGTPQARRWDFGLYNTTVENYYVNLDRYFDNYWFKYINADCPYDYFVDSLKDNYYSIFETSGGENVPGAECRNPSADSIGTVAGMWYLDNGADNVYTARFAIGANLADNQVRIGGIGSGLWINDNDPSFILPQNIIDEHCYFVGNTMIYFKLFNDTALGVYYKTGVAGCLDSFPVDSAKIYIR